MTPCKRISYELVHVKIHWKLRYHNMSQWWVTDDHRKGVQGIGHFVWGDCDRLAMLAHISGFPLGVQGYCAQGYCAQKHVLRICTETQKSLRGIKDIFLIGVSEVLLSQSHHTRISDEGHRARFGGDCFTRSSLPLNITCKFNWIQYQQQFSHLCGPHKDLTRDWKTMYCGSKQKKFVKLHETPRQKWPSYKHWKKV
jgi:hypothetical protein